MTTTICRSTDAFTQEVCQEMVDRFGATLTLLDQGYEETRGIA